MTCSITRQRSPPLSIARASSVVRASSSLLDCSPERPGLIGGSVIIETIFALPGLGQLFYAAVMARDYPLIMGNLVLGAVLTLAGNMLADIGYGLADPRIRAQGKRQ